MAAINSKLEPANTIFLECDIQEKIKENIIKGSTVIHNGKRLTQIAALLNIPIIATTHDQSKIGDVVDGIKDIKYKGRKVYDKHTFSMLGLDDIKVNVEVEGSLGRKNAVIYGAETHVGIK